MRTTWVPRREDLMTQLSTVPSLPPIWGITAARVDGKRAQAWRNAARVALAVKQPRGRRVLSFEHGRFEIAAAEAAPHGAAPTALKKGMAPGSAADLVFALPAGVHALLLGLRADLLRTRSSWQLYSMVRT